MLRTLFFTAVLALGWRTAAAATSPVVLALSYSCPDANIHIGSTITFDMAVGMVSTSADQAPVSNTVGTTDLWLSDSNIQNDSLLAPGAALLITDGTRTWAVASKVNTGAASYIDINDSEVIEGPVVGNYSQLAKNTFTVYAGSLVTSTANPTAIVWLRLGNLTFPDVTGFLDTGHLGDWRQTWTVTNIGGQYSNVSMSPYATIGGMAASLPSPLPGSWDISQMIDALAPQINLLKISSISGLSNFAGMMYIGASSQGANVDPKNANDTAIITVDSNKPNCQIRLSVINTAPTAYVDPQGYVPIASQLAPYEGALTWSGVNGAGNFVPDGQYMVQVDIQDANGVQGTSATALIYITSLKLVVQNLSLVPNQANAASTDTLLTNISYQVILKNDLGTNILPALNNLNWSNSLNPGGLTTANLNGPIYTDNVYAIMDVHVLDNSANEISAYSAALNGPDFTPTSDSDVNFIARTYLSPAGALSSLPSVGACTDVAHANPNAPTVSSVGSTVMEGDGNQGNDWDNTFYSPLAVSAKDAGGNPTQMSNVWSVAWGASAGQKPPVGQYQIYGKATLTGMEIIAGKAATSPNDLGCDANPDYVSVPLHCFPSSRPEIVGGILDATSYRGCALNGSSTIQAFTVYNNPATVQNTTPPLLVSTLPSSGSTVAPNVYGPSNPITVNLTDASPINAKASFISLSRSLGSLTQTITGVATNNTGAVVNGVNTLQLYFAPNQALTAGGTYTITIYAVDTKANSITYTTTFTILDQGTPSLSTVAVLDRTGNSYAVYPGSLSTPLDSAGQIVVNLAMNTLLSQNIITGNSAVALTRTDVTPTTSVILGTPILVSNTSATTLQITVPISPVITTGTYQISVLATSMNPGTNNAYSATYSGIQFSVVQPVSDINIYLGSQIVLAMVEPVTVTSNTTFAGGLNPTLITAQGYNMSYIKLPTGYVQLTGTAALNFYVDQTPNIGVNGHNLTFSSTNPVVMTLYFNAATAQSLGITPTALSILGWDLDTSTLDIDGPSTNTMADFISSAVWDYNAGTVNITFLPGKLVRDEIFFVGYNVATNTSGSPTAVPTPVRSTRSFNPNSSDPHHNKAVIYVAANTLPSPPNVDVKIYSMAGVVVRKFSQTAGLDGTNASSTDGYCYTWDGKNDGGSLVNNGIYLVITQVHLSNGISNTLKNVLAVIK